MRSEMRTRLGAKCVRESSYRHSYTHVHTQTHTVTHTYTPTHTVTHMYTHRHTVTHTYTPTHTLHTNTHQQTYTQLHTRTHQHTQLHTRTHVHTHHTRTHQHIPLFSSLSSPPPLPPTLLLTHMYTHRSRRHGGSFDWPDFFFNFLTLSHSQTNTRGKKWQHVSLSGFDWNSYSLFKPSDRQGHSPSDREEFHQKKSKLRIFTFVSFQNWLWPKSHQVLLIADPLIFLIRAQQTETHRLVQQSSHRKCLAL